MDFMSILYGYNLLNAKKEVFNKPSFILNNSEIIQNSIEFNITGDLLNNEYDFAYNNLLLEYKLESENSNISDIRNENCTIFNFNQSKYILQCKPNRTFKGKKVSAFSYLDDANLVVFFKNDENLINIGMKNNKIIISFQKMVKRDYLLQEF